MIPPSHTRTFAWSSPTASVKFAHDGSDRGTNTFSVDIDVNLHVSRDLNGGVITAHTFHDAIALRNALDAMLKLAEVA